MDTYYKTTYYKLAEHAVKVSPAEDVKYYDNIIEDLMGEDHYDYYNNVDTAIVASRFKKYVIYSWLFRGEEVGYWAYTFDDKLLAIESNGGTRGHLHYFEEGLTDEAQKYVLSLYYKPQKLYYLGKDDTIRIMLVHPNPNDEHTLSKTITYYLFRDNEEPVRGNIESKCPDRLSMCYFKPEGGEPIYTSIGNLYKVPFDDFEVYSRL